MWAGLDMAVSQEDWKNAAIYAGNLSELELTLGRVSDAVSSAEQAVQHADRSRDDGQRIIQRTTLADALHQAGQRDDARALFREAEALQEELEPSSPQLYSLQGFRYCDLLLADTERAAWTATRQLRAAAARTGDSRPGSEESSRAEHTEICVRVHERAERALEIARSNNHLISIALDHLTLSRVALYRSVLTEPTALQSPAPEDRRGFDLAVDGLRSANTIHHLPRGLLTRAWCLRLTGDETAAHADLDEAWEIAERGSMKLHMADVHLHRARLFDDREALAEARKLIEECGYNRRLPELEDAEAALLWQGAAPLFRGALSEAPGAATGERLQPRPAKHD
jgi:tetratricopeptide (TPR) repeat protein